MMVKLFLWSLHILIDKNDQGKKLWTNTFYENERNSST